LLPTLALPRSGSRVWRCCTISAGKIASTPSNSMGIVSHERKIVKYTEKVFFLAIAAHKNKKVQKIFWKSVKIPLRLLLYGV
jgi:hypothetical protein